ncbi:hypothetical protein GH722_06725 [Alphaproteobacteria bacterium HT1-32]|nr:hypothetical protein [Alphaproteobacteria bacterium HT1-32]
MKVLITGLMVSVLSLTGCVTGERDSGGTVMQLTPAQEVAFPKTDLTIPLYLHEHIASVTQEIRDNASPIDNYNLGEKGSVQSQRASSWFSEKTEDRTASREEFDKRLGEITNNRSIDSTITELSHNDRVRTRGFAARIRRGTVNCIYARGGYRLGGPSPYDNDRGLIDTIIEVWACGDDDLIKATEDMMAGVRKVNDRDAYAEELRKAGA